MSLGWVCGMHVSMHHLDVWELCDLDQYLYAWGTHV
jgi:hypothetical protein